MTTDTPPERDEIRVVGIAGPSGAGKTTLARAVAARSGGVVVALDAYYRDQRAVAADVLNVDVPEAIDVDLLVSQLRALAAGTAVAQPVYDFATHARTAATRAVQPAGVIVVEGLFALYWPQLRDLMHTRVFLSLDHDECLRRRVARDVRERGRTPEQVASQFARTVRPMYERHVEPTRRHAQLVLDGTRRIDHLTERVLLAIREQGAGGAGNLVDPDAR